MKRFLISAAAIVVAVTAPLAAQAAPWQSVNQRQANIERRIDQGVSNGQITRPEAASLREKFRALERLETQYRRSGGGLSANERNDLDARFDRLSRSVKSERHDRDNRKDGGHNNRKDGGQNDRKDGDHNDRKDGGQNNRKDGDHNNRDNRNDGDRRG